MRDAGLFIGKRVSERQSERERKHRIDLLTGIVESPRARNPLQLLSAVAARDAERARKVTARLATIVK